MEKKFTPGPWAYYECMSHGLAGGDTTLAVGSDLEVRDHICFLRVGGIGLPQDQVEANARLIAAAPKLLKALIDLKATLDPYDYQYGNQVHIIDTAIIEAVGVQGSKTLRQELTEKYGTQAFGALLTKEESEALYQSEEVVLEVDGLPFTWQEFYRENSGEDAMLSDFDLARVEALKVGESLYLGIQEVKRIQ